MSSYTNPNVQDFKDYFVRDFPYGSDPSQVMDSDILKAETQTAYFINPNLFCDQGQYQIGFLLLSAHFLVMNLRASSQGIAGQYSWLTASKGVASVSESFAIPERITENPELAMLSKTTYGAQFLFMVLPQLTGQVFTVRGLTHP